MTDQTGGALVPLTTKPEQREIHYGEGHENEEEPTESFL